MYIYIRIIYIEKNKKQKKNHIQSLWDQSIINIIIIIIIIYASLYIYYIILYYILFGKNYLFKK
jgi:hypothetical protein